MTAKEREEMAQEAIERAKAKEAVREAIERQRMQDMSFEDYYLMIHDGYDLNDLI